MNSNFEMAPERTILIGSFSKLTSPGLRVGFVVSDNRWSSRIAAWIRLCCWMPCLLSSEIISNWIENGHMEKLQQAKVRDLKDRLKIAVKYLTGFKYQSNPYSNYIRLKLPEEWEAQKIAASLLRQSIVVRGAEAFTIGRTSVPRAMRLSLGTSPDIIELECTFCSLRDVLNHHLYKSGHIK